MLAAVLRDHCLVEDQVLVEVRLIVAGVVIAVVVEYVGADVREVCAREAAAQEIETVVELVVADIADVVVEQVHCLVNRVNLALVETALTGNEIAERITLQQVAIIGEHAVMHFGARLADQCGCARQAITWVRGVLVVVVIDDVHVEIRGLHDPEVYGRVGPGR